MSHIVTFIRENSPTIVGGVGIRGGVLEDVLGFEDAF